MTIEELYDKIVADDELKEAAAKAAESGDIAEWAKEQGVEATEDEIAAFLQGKADAKLDLGDVDQVAGGTWDSVSELVKSLVMPTVGVCSSPRS